MTNNGAHDPKERAVAFGIAARDDKGSARLDDLRADFQSSPPRERMQLALLLEQMCGPGVDLSVVQHLQTGEGEEVDPRWKGCSILVSYIPSESLGTQSSACPWRLLPSGHIEYAYPVAPQSAPIVPDQPPVVLRVQVWRPRQHGFLEGYWSFNTSANAPEVRNRPRGQARWSLCDLDEGTTAKAFDAWINLYRQHAARGPKIGGSQNSFKDVDEFVAVCQQMVARVAAEWGAAEWKQGRSSRRLRNQIVHLYKTQFASWIGISTKSLRRWLKKSHERKPSFDWSDIERMWDEHWRR